MRPRDINRKKLLKAALIGMLVLLLYFTVDCSEENKIAAVDGVKIGLQQLQQ
jgi:hypothetical protein